jgi:hypothetical protein
MKALRPFWRYYGGKWRAAPRYPRPEYPTIIEPFAGAAGYSLRYPERSVVLVEKYNVIAEIWRWLIGASESEILSVPCVDHVDDVPAGVSQGARWLVGFCMNSASASPRNTLSAGQRKLRAMGRRYEGWSEAKRALVASQVRAIRHWRVIEGDYSAAPDIEATWFVDPPYQLAGIHYKHASAAIDFPSLGAWCQSRAGQVIACEAAGADWLPFVPFMDAKSFGAAGKNKTSAEAIWTNREVRYMEKIEAAARGVSVARLCEVAR